MSVHACAHATARPVFIVTRSQFPVIPPPLSMGQWDDGIEALDGQSRDPLSYNRPQFRTLSSSRSLAPGHKWRLRPEAADFVMSPVHRSGLCVSVGGRGAGCRWLSGGGQPRSLPLSKFQFPAVIEDIMGLE